MLGIVHDAIAPQVVDIEDILLMLHEKVANVVVAAGEGLRFRVHLRRGVISCKLQLDHSIHQLQECQSPKNLSSREYIRIGVNILVRDEICIN